MDPKVAEAIHQAIEKTKEGQKKIFDIYRYRLLFLDRNPSFHENVRALSERYGCENLEYESDWHVYNLDAPGHFAFCSMHYVSMSHELKEEFERNVCLLLVQYDVSPVYFTSLVHLILYGDRHFFEARYDGYEIDLCIVVKSNLDLLPKFKLTTYEKWFIKDRERQSLGFPKKGRPSKSVMKTSAWEAYRELCRLVDKCPSPERGKKEDLIIDTFLDEKVKKIYGPGKYTDMMRADTMEEISDDDLGDEAMRKATNRIRQTRHRTLKRIRLENKKIT